MLMTYAATFSISIEPENGAPNDLVHIDAGASGGRMVKFGATGGGLPDAIWKPAQLSRWQWVLSGKVDTSEVNRFDMYDIDLQAAMPAVTQQTITWPASAQLGSSYSTTITWPKGENAGIIAALKAQGKKVVCYMDTGAFEDYRPDASAFPGGWGKSNNRSTNDSAEAKAMWGNTVPYVGPPEFANKDVIGGDSSDSSGGTFSGEYWLDTREASWQYFAPIIWARLDLAKKVGCDGVEGDQNNAYGNDSTFGVNEAISLRWYREVFYQTRQRGMSSIAKNGVELISQMLSDPSNISYCANGGCQPDGFLNEECQQYKECDAYDVATNKGLWVGQVEYKGNSSGICPDANAKKRMAMRKPQYDPVDMRISFACWE